MAALAEELRDGRHTEAYDLSDVTAAADELAGELDDPDVWELADLASELARMGR